MIAAFGATGSPARWGTIEWKFASCGYRTSEYVSHNYHSKTETKEISNPEWFRQAMKHMGWTTPLGRRKR